MRTPCKETAHFLKRKRREEGKTKEEGRSGEHEQGGDGGTKGKKAKEEEEEKREEGRDSASLQLQDTASTFQPD